MSVTHAISGAPWANWRAKTFGVTGNAWRESVVVRKRRRRRAMSLRWRISRATRLRLV
jgi:hypothetical protein